MSVFSKSVDTPYTPEQAFELVSDIARYPDFIKWVTAMRVSDVRVREDGVTEFTGEAAIGFRGVAERFSTSVVSDAEAGVVTAKLIRGPFKHLQAEWSITELGTGGANISLSIDYEFRNPILRMLAAANENMAANRIMDAFLSEAKRRYAGVATS